MKAATRKLTKKDFDRAYQKVVLNNSFFEKDNYYIQQKPRYFQTIKYLCSLELPEKKNILEIGGGQIALLMKELFNDTCTIADVNEAHKSGILNYGVDFLRCDLLHDNLEEKSAYDLVIMCEVIEHMPIPPHIILEKIKTWIKPNGLLFLTTPNLYRFRNLIRLALGMRVFDTFLIPERGKSIGHPIEYSKTHMEWQLKEAGFSSINIELKQLDNAGSSFWTQLGRIIATPVLLRPLWKDKLVATAVNSEDNNFE